VLIALFLVEKLPLNCISAIKTLLHASVNGLSTIVQKVSVYCIFHTRRTGLNCCLLLFFSRFFVRSLKKSCMQHVPAPAALGTIFTSRAIIIHFLHLLHK
jgi:hypothetical protein